MPLIQAWGFIATPPNAANLSTSQAGNGQSTNFADRLDRFAAPGLLQIVTTIGSTPTCTYSIEGSADGVTWWAVSYADIATPETSAVATFVVTTATTTLKILRANQPWRYIRLTYSANTNVTNTADVFIF